MKRAFRSFLAFAVASAALVAACSEQRPADMPGNTARAARVAALSAVSGPSPFAPDGCGQPEIPIYEALPPEIDGPDNDGQEFGVEFDLSIAVNPRNPDHIVVAWVQDKALGILVSVSFDGGRAWQRVVLPALTFCEDSPEERTFHARLSFGPDGLLYLAVEADDGLFPDPRQIVSIRVPVSVSTDGGLSWTTSYVDGGTAQGTKGLSTLAAEPDIPGAALVAWHTEGSATVNTYLARTVDGGQTWTRMTVRPGDPGSFPFNRILPLRDGSWLVFDADIPPDSVLPIAAGFVGIGLIPDSGSPVRVRRSTDKGESWSEPVTLAAGAFPQWAGAAQAPDGAVYASWLAPNEEGVATQFVSRSDDDGVSWSEAVAVAAPDDLHAALAVAGNGTVGFVYTDHRNDVPDDAAVQRDAWLAYSRDRGQTWHELHIAGPFELGTEDLGAYQETTSLPDGFAAAVLLGPPLALDGRTDVFFARIVVE